MLKFDPRLDETEFMSTPAVVEIKTVDGWVYSKRVDFAKGNHRNPVSWMRLERTSGIVQIMQQDLYQRRRLTGQSI